MKTPTLHAAVFFFLGFATTAFAQILSVSPTQNAMNVSPKTGIAVTFNADMLAATLKDSTFVVWGMQSGLHQGAISYNAALRRATLAPFRPFESGEIVAVTLTGDVQTSAQQPLQKFAWHFTTSATPSAGKFPLKTDYDTGLEPAAVFAADLDRDQDLDLIVANRDGNTVSIFKNIGNGKFQPKQDYPAGNLPSFIFAVDFDADKDVDLAVLTKTAAGKDVAAIFKNTGAGTFLPRVEYETGLNPPALFAADVDADGDLDLAATSSAGVVSILKNNGNATFKPKVDFAAGRNPQALFAADLDNDGDTDLAAADNAGNEINILKNDGAGAFPAKTTYNVPGTPASLFAADFDKDGDMDLATTTPASKKISILNNKNDGTFPARIDLNTDAELTSLRAADLDGDGDADLAATASNQTVAVLKNNGDATWQAPVYYKGGFASASLITADVDDDNDLELIFVDTISDKVVILTNRSLLYTNAADLRFNAAYIGYPKDLSFKLYNGGSTSANITNITSTNASFVAISAKTFALAGGDSAMITIRYAPAAATSDTGTVTILPNGFAPIRIAVSGAGVPPGPVINVSPAALSFGNTSVNKIADLMLTVSNTGVVALEIANMTLGNQNFSLAGGKKHVIPPNSYKLIAMRFTPPVLGPHSDTLKIFSNAAANSPVKIPLSGSGTSNALPEISVKPLELRFDSILVKSSKILALRVYNRGAANLNVTDIASNNNKFDVMSARNFTLPPNDSSEVTIKFTPTQVGLLTGTLSITCNDANENPLAIKLSGFSEAIPAPRLTKIFPALGNRLQTLTVACKGANFIAGVTSLEVGDNIAVNKITVHRSDSLTASLTIAAIAETGARDFFVTNSSPGGGVSEKQIFTVNNPTPLLAKINPALGYRLQKFNIGFKGANFISGVTTVSVGPNITINKISVHRSDTMTVNVTITEEAAIGARAISVNNDGPGGGVSNTQDFTVNYPAPALTSIAPGKGDRGQTLDVAFKGANFLAGVTTVNAGEGIKVNAITVTSANNLTANLTIATTAAGARDFSVTNPGPGGGTSGAQTFLVNTPAPTLKKLTPNSASLLQTLDVGFKGTNFISGLSTVNVGPEITVNRVTVQQPDSLTANLTIGANATIGARNFSVTNPGPGGGNSGNVPFVVNKPPPVLTSIFPGAGARFQTLDVGFKGANFVDGLSSVNVGPNITLNAITVHRADSLTANITINVNAVTGARNFSVSNGNGVVSESRAFTVNNPVPRVASINPLKGERLQKLTVSFTGENFIGGVSAVNVGQNIAVGNVTVHRPDSMTATIIITAEANAGPRSFSVTNSGIGGGNSENQTFTVHNPAPVLTSLNPLKGGRGQTLSVGFKGASFFSGVTTANVGAGITVNNITVHRLDSLTANIAIAANAEYGPRQFSVTNAGPGGGTSASGLFMVSYPAPTLSKINPAGGARLQTLDVGFKGTNFFSGVSNVNAGPNIVVNRVTVHRPDSLTANLTIGANAEPESRQFAVSNGEGAVSENRVFMVNNPAPVLRSIAPFSAYRKQRVDIVFTGANFINKTTVVNVGPGIIIHSIIVNNSSNLVANLTVTPDAARGPRDFSVTNPAPGGGVSAEQLFIVINNEPSKPQLLSPANNEVIQLSRQRPPIKFLWSRSLDNDREDTVKYVINLKGAGLDTTFAAVKDTSALLDIMPLLKVNSTYSWDLKVSDGVVTVTWPDRAAFRTSSTVTSVQERHRLIPSEFHLEQNYPNPFALSAKSAESTIKYQLPQEAFVTLKIFDMLGREVITLVNALQPLGYYNVRWNGKNSAGKSVPGGVYIYRLQAGNFERVMKMMVVR